MIVNKLILPLYKRPVLLWTFLYLFVRLFFLFANDGIIFDTKIEGLNTGQIIFKEEFNNSTPARELLWGNSKMLDGVIQCGYGITGGEYYQMLLFVPILKIFGESYYAIKLLPFSFLFLLSFF